MITHIGTVEVWRIIDSLSPFLPVTDLFPTAGPDVADLIESKAPGSVDACSGCLILPIQGFLLRTPTHTILVDSCVGNDKTVPNLPDWHQRQGTRFMASLAAAGATVEDVDYVLCTHLHTDHVGWNTRLHDGRWVPTFPNATYLFPRADDDAIKGDATPTYTESISPVIAAGQAQLIEAPFQLTDQVQLIPTPGHTPGHVSVQITCGAHRAIITGDALHSSAQTWYPDWHFKYDKHPDQAVQSRRMLLGTAAELGCTVLGSHFSLPSIGRVKAKGDAFAWHPL